MNTLELKVLATIIDEIGIITLNKNVNTYKLCLYIKYTDFPSTFYYYFIGDINEHGNYWFNKDNTNNRYYIYGSKVITLLELIKHNYFNINNEYKIKLLLLNKHLFTRSKGKKLTKEELEQLANLYTELRK